MKKLLSALAVVVLSVSLFSVPVFADPHTHTFGAWSVTPSNGVIPSHISRICSVCGASEIQWPDLSYDAIRSGASGGISKICYGGQPVVAAVFQNQNLLPPLEEFRKVYVKVKETDSYVTATEFIVRLSPAGNYTVREIPGLGGYTPASDWILQNPDSTIDLSDRNIYLYYEKKKPVVKLHGVYPSYRYVFELNGREVNDSDIELKAGDVITFTNTAENWYLTDGKETKHVLRNQKIKIVVPSDPVSDGEILGDRRGAGTHLPGITGVLVGNTYVTFMNGCTTAWFKLIESDF